MSVYKRPGSETWSYDFRLRGHRFSGSTGATSRREAERAQARAREAAREKLDREKAGTAAPMTVEVATSRYWLEVGQHHRGGGADNTLWSLDWLKENIGPQRLILDIDDAVVAELVAKRRGEPIRSGQNRKKRTPAAAPRLVAAATVNRSVTEPLRKVLNRARRTWKQAVAEVSWRDHMLREPKERVREMKAEEESRLFATMRPDYHPVIRFVLLTGLRLDEVWKLRWQDIDWGSRRITVHGKGAKIDTIPMAPDVRELLWSLQGHHDDAVFTYVVARTTTHPVTKVRRLKGERRPLTRSGLQTAFRRAMPGAKIENFSFHDNRHTAATRLLRAGGNLKVVQRLLRHEQITTTTKYAHVTDVDVMEAMQRAAEHAKAAQAALATANPTENATNDGAEEKSKAG